MQILQEQISVHAVVKRLLLVLCLLLRAPNGLFSIKAPVLGAANERNTIRA